MSHPTIVAAIVYPLASALLAAILTRWLVGAAGRHGMIDMPNARSSHRHPVPRGGGLAIVIVLTLASVSFTITGLLASHAALALLGALPVAAVGLIDDRAGVPAPIRFAVHLGASIWAVAWLWPIAPQPVSGGHVEFGLLGAACTVIGLVWAINLFNFMDGIDGLAASQAIFMAAGAASIGVGQPGLGLVCWCLAAACAGFLVWNWSPARIFMGDVGSGFIGYVLGVLALASLASDSMNFWTWLVLGGLFLADSTVTVARRVIRRERWFEAHRLHAYQRLATRWHSHARVTTVWALVNLFLVLPAAHATTISEWASRVGSALLIAAFALMLALGAGRRHP